MVRELTDYETTRLLEGTASTQVRLDPEDVLEQCKSMGLRVSREVVVAACAALNIGKHLILIGAPGTGKTTLANVLCTVARIIGASVDDHVFMTGTADWSSFDTVGGYMPVAGDSSRLEFIPAPLLSAIRDGRWVLIDELNRADIDKAIGPLFSVLSNHRTLIPYRVHGKPVTIGPGDTPSAAPHEFIVRPTWRIVATMNDVDKMSLFDVSHAFMRRFAVVEVAPLRGNDLRDFVNSQLQGLDLRFADDLVQALVGISDQVRSLGPAIVIDFVNFVKEYLRCELDRNTDTTTNQADKALVAEAAVRKGIEAFLSPQLEGLSSSEMRKVRQYLEIFAGWRFSTSKLLYERVDDEADNEGSVSSTDESEDADPPEIEVEE